MSADSSGGNPRAGSAAHTASDPYWDAARNGTVGYELLAELGRGAGVVAILARKGSGALAALRVEASTDAPGGPVAYRVTEHSLLDDSIPAPASRCQVCATTLTTWRGPCVVCGHRLFVSEDAAPSETDLITALNGHAGGAYRVLGPLRFTDGGIPIYFAHERARDALVALRLSPRPAAAGAPASFAVEVLPLTSDPHVAPIPASGMTQPLFSTTGGSATAAEPEYVCLECGGRYTGVTKFCPKDGAPLQKAVSDGLIGQMIDGRYLVEARLGQGGMGEVYLAKQVRTGRKCALKLMHRSLTTDADAVGRFRREAASACAVSHPNIATVYDYGEMSDGVPYFAMEYVEGQPLSGLLTEMGALPPARAVDIARQIADALSAAHDHSIVHRDLKPDNVMLAAARGGADLVKVVDFGIAKMTHAEAGQITKTGYVLGTVAYMSPEQIRGDVLDGRTDLYSLGCVLYEMLTGQSTCPGASAEMVLVQRLTEPPPEPRAVNESVPRALNDIVVRLLAKAPEERYQTAHELSEELLNVQLEPESASWFSSLGGKKPTRPAASPRTPSRARPTPVMLDQIDTTTGVSNAPPPAPPLSPAIPMPARSGSRAAVSPNAPTVRARVPAKAKPNKVLFGGIGALVVVAATLLLFMRGDSPPTTEPVTPAVGGPAAEPSAPADPTAGAPSAPSGGQPSAGTNPSPGASAQPSAPARGTSGTPAGGGSATGKANAPQPTAPPPASVTPAPQVTPPPVQTAQPPVIAAPPIDSSRILAQIAAASAARRDSLAAATARADAERAATETVRRYIAAIAARDLPGMLRAYPGLPAQQQENWRGTFRNATELTAQIVSFSNFQLTGDDAEIGYTFTQRMRMQGGAVNEVRPTLRAVLRKVEGVWQIVRIETP